MKFNPVNMVGGGGGGWVVYSDPGTVSVIPDGDGINNCGGCGECHECAASKT